MNATRNRKAGPFGGRRWRVGRWGWGACVAVLATIAGACGPPTENVLTDANGQSIRMEAIDRILDNSNLTEEEKRQRLQGLGITDEDLIDALIQAG